MEEGATTRRFELLCVFMLSFGQLCIMTGYDSQAFILESVIHSIHEREPETISIHSGYYGQAVCYLTYVFACFISPSFLYATSAKTTLLVSAICFTSFHFGFFFTNTYYYYLSSAVSGIGFALYYTGNGDYMTSHSTRQTIGSNVSMSWGLSCCCMMIGAVIMAVITSLTATGVEIGSQRSFSDGEIYLLFSAFAAISMIAVITFILIPSKDVSNCIESSEKRVEFMQGIRLMKKALMSPKMFRLAPSFLLCGIHTSFWISVYPTSLMFNAHNAAMIYLPAIYCFAVGLGETLMGLVISTMSKRIEDFGLRPTMLIGCCSTILYCLLALLTTPFNATTTPTTLEPLFLSTNTNLSVHCWFDWWHQ
ncbi:unnamed protein product [Caenorhabditis angaria]|uniref:Uncharacterized protein n=1 Tax=Caenorhabditis angaria TaxID=860376 RepID=A0A9P1N6Z8_9PELO|nr:unnamed protein product [Caenorhabditis angaria]